VGGAATNATGAQLERLVRNVRRAFESSAEDSPPAATLTEGMEHIAQLALAGMAAERPDAAPRGRSRLTAYIDPLSGRLPDGEVLPPAALEAVADPLSARHALRPLTVEDLTCHDLGRTQRLPRLALRELVATLDGERCRFRTVLDVASYKPTTCCFGKIADQPNWRSYSCCVRATTPWSTPKDSSCT